MADRKRAPKTNALNVERATLAVGIIEEAFDLLLTFMPPSPKLYTAREMFLAYKRDFDCYRAQNFLPATPGPVGAESEEPPAEQASESDLLGRPGF